jgi:hypothetical protein
MLGEVFMSYEEIKHSDGSFRRQWWTEGGKPHREDGPAIIWYHSDGSILEEDFYFHGYLGINDKGFWALWGRLTDEQRQKPELLKYLVRFS